MILHLDQTKALSFVHMQQKGKKNDYTRLHLPPNFPLCITYHFMNQLYIDFYYCPTINRLQSSELNKIFKCVIDQYRTQEKRATAYYIFRVNIISMQSHVLGVVRRNASLSERAWVECCMCYWHFLQRGRGRGNDLLALGCFIKRTVRIVFLNTDLHPPKALRIEVTVSYLCLWKCNL